jgi:hypothetical protein
MEIKKEYKSSIFGQLIQLLEIIHSWASALYANIFSSDNQSRCSDFQLIVVGGEPIYGTSIHQALSLLNRKLNFPIEAICTDYSLRLLYYQLLNRVTIVKFVSKMLDSEKDEQDSDDDEKEAEVQENQQVQVDDDSKKQRNIFLKI